MSSMEERIVPKGKNVDIGWEFNSMVEANNTKKVRCNYCGHVSNGGITRAKDHQMGKKGEVTSCVKTPEHVKETLRGAIKKKNDAKNSYVEVDEDVDMEEVEEISKLRSQGKRLNTMLTTSSQASKKIAKGPMCRYVHGSPEASVQSKKKQSTINDHYDKEARERTCQYICRFLYNNGISFNVVKSKSFKVMLEAVGQYGPHLKPPSYHEVRVPFLKKEVEYTNDLMKRNLEERSKVGCSIMSDGWSDRKNRGLINFLVNTPSGSMFVRSIDASSFSKTGEKIFELLDSFVVEMGVENVVQVVTDNGSNYKLAGELLEVKRPNLFWTPCAAHCIDLMLEDIGKIPRVKRAIKNGITIVGFIYNHSASLNLMRKFTNKGELVRFGITRFATSFLTLQRLNTVKNCLRRMFNSDEWKACKDSRDRKGKLAAKIVLMFSFWNDVVYTLKAMGPLVKVLRLVDNEKKPAMGYVYEAIENARNLIKTNFDDEEEKYKDVLHFVDSRWEFQLHHPLHAAGHYLNPMYYYRDSSIEDDEKITTGFHQCVQRLCSHDAQDAIYGVELYKYKEARGSFGLPNAIAYRNTQSAAQWWGTWGNSTPHLRQFAIKVLSLTCSSSGCERNWSTFEQVVKARHTTQGRQGAIIQVELRDVDSGGKTNERLQTDEAIEKVFVQSKQLTYLYTDDETGNIVLMDPETYGQVEVPRHLFDDSVVYLQDDMKVTIELFDERPMSASLPTRVTCTVAEAGDANKQSSKSTPSKKVVLDNGVTIQVPSHISTGDKIVINTMDNTYMSKA